MFAGLIGVERNNQPLLHSCGRADGGRASGAAGSAGRKRLHRRPGYMRGEQCRLQSSAYGREEEEEEEEEEGRTARVRSPTPAVRVGQRQPGGPTGSSWRSCGSPWDCTASTGASGRPAQPSAPRSELRSSPSPSPAQQDTFSSSFSFIQQSLGSGRRTDATAAAPEPLHPPRTPPGPTPTAPTAPLGDASEPGRAQRVDLSLGGRFWRESLWSGSGASSDLPDCDARSPDADVTSSLSVDSDTASASSVTSGYESATPGCDQGWDGLVKQYEGVLQDCLQNNRTHTTIESMMLKLQRLQQKAILEDDYDAAERFGKKLEELCRERGALQLGLPSRQPSVDRFLERLRQVVHSALQRADCSQRSECAESEAAEQGLLCQRGRLIQEKRLVEEEIAALQQKLAQLQRRGRSLEQQIQQEEQQAEAEELESSVLRSCSVAQLRAMGRALQDLVTSDHRLHISVSPSASILRLQEQEQTLNLSIKEATAKVVMSQRLGSSLRRKVSETETQLLALHEAKLAAISGSDFSSAKELKAEMKAVYQERDRLEALAKRLHSLSSGSSQELARTKEQRQQLRQELEHREAQHERRLKENTTKYMELLEDRLHSCSCSCPGLERIWEADLEACHLFLRGLQQRTPSCSGADVDLVPSGAATQPGTREEEDSAMLTALGGRWCPEANLQNSEFTKDVSGEAEAADLTERCELISDRLMTLEDELQTAILNRDQALAQSLEKEVQDVKATLQGMLAQLKEEDAQEEQANDSGDDDLARNGTEEEEEEEEEDQYFSDSWDI
ncbi:disrupted in schizophrenia 1 protein isoform X2 [Betta splendens]|uniref:Disrupted in schizophrenia 1 protein isoform X2 n=1 Tax=Betta splendens TaxID=158456 RepID=A0A9W2X9Y9_BETSP|nr:disrupted in schizophrenia 1 protein isoform X2 [Betta splendens]